MDRPTNKMTEPNTLQAAGSAKEPNQGQSPDELNSTTGVPAASTKLVYSVQELGGVLGCSVSTIYEGLRRGTIPSLRISKRKYLIPCAAIASMLEAGNAK